MKPTRRSVSRAVAEALHAQGHADVTEAQVGGILTAWLAGARGLHLPLGIVGMLVGKHLDDLEAEQPGALHQLRRS